MHRTDNSRFLLYIEPKAKEKRLNPVKDELSEMMQIALKLSENGVANYDDLESNGSFTKTNKGYRGVHFTECGEHSTNQDYLLENGMITNSLAPFYLMYYRNSIPKNEIKKAIQLFLFYKLGRNQNITDVNMKYNPIVLWLLKFRFWGKLKHIPYPRAPLWNYAEFEEDDDLPME